MGTTSARRARQLPAYDAARSAIAKIRTASVPGDPKATAPALLRIVDAAEPPLRVFFVDGGLPMVKDECGAHRDLGKVERRGAGSARQSRRSLRRRLTQMRQRFRSAGMPLCETEFVASDENSESQACVRKLN